MTIEVGSKALRALYEALQGPSRLVCISPNETQRSEHCLYELSDDRSNRLELVVYEPLVGGPLPITPTDRFETTNLLAGFQDFLGQRLHRTNQRDKPVVFVRSFESLMRVSPEAPATFAGILEYLPERAISIVVPLEARGEVRQSAPYLFDHSLVRWLRLPDLEAAEVAQLLERSGNPVSERIVSEALTLPYDRLANLTSDHYPDESRLLARIGLEKENLALETGLVEIDTSRQGAELFGLDRLWAHFVQEVLPYLKAGRDLEGKGILLLGPPGTGKTQAAAAMAGALQKRLFKIRPQLGPYVGQSEQQIKQVLAIVERAAPCVALFDEISRELSGYNTANDGGAMSRTVAEIMTWVEHQRRVFVVATSNATELDSALLRPGRLHPHFYVGPNPETRRGLLLKGRKEFGLELSDPEIEDISQMAVGFSGARMWQIVRRARRHIGSQRTHIENLIRQEKGQVELERRQYAALRERGEPASSQLDP